MRFAKPGAHVALALTGASLLLGAGAALAEKSDPVPGYLPHFAAPSPNTNDMKVSPGSPTVPVRDVKRETPAQADTEKLEIEWSKGAKPAAPRAMEMEVPLQEDKFRLGDVKVKISPQGDVSIAKERLLQIMLPLMRPEAGEALRAAAGEREYVPLAALTSKGFAFRWDENQVTLFVDLTIDQTAKRSLSGSQRREQVMSENLQPPAMFAGYMNVHAGIDYVEQSHYGATGIENMRLDLQGAARWHSFVLEAEATMEDGGLNRRGTRVIYDMRDHAVRIIAGDVAPLVTGFQGGADLLGVSVEKSYQKLQPGANIRPTSGHSFRIERPSTVDIKINGFVTQRLHLRPGDYDLSDLPLTGGANDIELIIEDDTGQRRTLTFSVFSGMSLLAPGVSEWAVTAGVQSYMGRGYCGGGTCGSQLEYDFGEPVVTGFYQRGLTTAITGSAHFQTDARVFMGGAGALFATSFGFFGVNGAVSQSVDFGPGFALHTAYELANLKTGDGVRRSVRLAAEYRSANFAVVDVIDPRNDTTLNLSASYSQDLPWDLSGSLSANYGFGAPGYGDTYGVDVSLGRNFGPFLSAGLTVGYERDANSDCADASLQRDGFRAAMRLNYRLDEKSSIDTSHDTRDNRSQVAYRRQEGSGVGSWSTQVQVDRQAGNGGYDDDYNVNGSVAYVGNRADVAVSHYTSAVGLNTSNLEQRSSVTVGTALAFADGAMAVGRPVSNGFAIVLPHDSLRGSEVAVGTQDSKRAGTDILGPALVNDVSPYSQTRLPVDVSDLPVGYDLGAGGFDLYAPYKAGYRLTVGSDYTVTVTGTLLQDDGEPIPLLTGDAYEEGHKDDKDHHVPVFTGRTGKFGASGMRPGRWIVEMATEPPARFVIDVPKDTVGLLKAGTLRPAKGA